MPQLKKQRKEGEKNKPFPLSSSFSLHLPAATKGCPSEGGREEVIQLPPAGTRFTRGIQGSGFRPISTVLAYENCFGSRYLSSTRHPGGFRKELAGWQPCLQALQPEENVSLCFPKFPCLFFPLLHKGTSLHRRTSIYASLHCHQSRWVPARQPGCPEAAWVRV